MAKRKSTPRLFGTILVADRFSGCAAARTAVHRGSTTEYTGLSKLGESLSTMNKQVGMPGEEEQRASIGEKYANVLDGLNFSLSVPPRVPFEAIPREEYKRVEEFAFNRWKAQHKDKVFERNIELWRQFWIACERADTIAQIVDSRDPEFFINQDILVMYPGKSHLILCNKFDLIPGCEASTPMRHGGLDTYAYSTRRGPFTHPLTGKVCLIGYPNVGKSSTINHILQHKKVKVSSTPGKTKHIQTIETPNFVLIDCPGLVFPKHSKVDLALHGVLNVDQVQELGGYEGYVLDYIGRPRLCAYYRLSPATTDILQAAAEGKSWPKSRCLRYMIRDYAEGLI